MKRRRDEDTESREDVTAWLNGEYDNPQSPDITIDLSDGSKLYLTRFLLYSRNRYFDALCGPKSQFTETNLKDLKLEEDDADAIKATIRNIYAFRLDAHSDHTTQYWINLVKVADKYLEPSLVEKALSNVERIAAKYAQKAEGNKPDSTDAKTSIRIICNILDLIPELKSQDSAQAVQLSRKSVLRTNFAHLDPNQRFAAHVYENSGFLKEMAREYSLMDICQNHLDYLLKDCCRGFVCIAS